MEWRAAVRVTLKPGVLDPQGKAVQGALHAQGFRTVSEVRVGKYIQLALTAESRREAEEAVERMCRALLANPVLEQFAIRVWPAEQGEEETP
ncbi:MAG: phosphoribosylformylglycinamidine synthase subunit PurS [Bacillota bacterium]|nr:phosphoribosylformylglycinamidine synthase subunit PurS [Bacillota bacterium]